MLAIIKKEFKSYFLSPVGYVFIGLFLIMFSIFFYTDVFGIYHLTNFEYIFYSGATILTFITPILTMRTIAEERKNGTEQLILTSPISITKVVLGKFIAATLIVIITELCTLMYFVILSFFGMPHITALVTLLGFLLLAMSYISFGILASSITENQIIAGVITIGFFILLWFLPQFNSIFSNFSLINMFSDFPTGQINIADTVTYIAFTVACLLLTIIFMQRRKSVR